MQPGSIVIESVSTQSKAASDNNATSSADCACMAKKAAYQMAYARRYYRYKMLTNGIQTLAAIITIIAMFRLVRDN